MTKFFMGQHFERRLPAARPIVETPEVVKIVNKYCKPSEGIYYTFADMIKAYELGRDHAWHLERNEEY